MHSHFTCLFPQVLPLPPQTIATTAVESLPFECVLIGLGCGVMGQYSLLEHARTSADLVASCGDLKLLGKREFKQLLKWRQRMSDYLKKLDEEEDEEGDEEETEGPGESSRGAADAEVDSEQEEVDLEEEMVRMEQRLYASEKSARRKERQKEIKRFERLGSYVCGCTALYESACACVCCLKGMQSQPLSLITDQKYPRTAPR